jgi:hypothetical protein
MVGYFDCGPYSNKDAWFRIRINHGVCKFDVHGSVHHRWFSRNTNKMQVCNIIYYSKVYWRLNMFRAAHHSSPGAINCICSLWFTYPCGDRPLPRLSGKSALATACHHMDI